MRLLSLLEALNETPAEPWRGPHQNRELMLANRKPVAISDDYSEFEPYVRLSGFIRDLQQSVLVERTLDLPNIRVLADPNSEQIAGMARKAPDNHLRGVVGSDGHVFVWVGFYATHLAVWSELRDTGLIAGGRLPSGRLDYGDTIQFEVFRKPAGFRICNVTKMETSYDRWNPEFVWPQSLTRLNAGLERITAVTESVIFRKVNPDTRQRWTINKNPTPKELLGMIQRTTEKRVRGWVEVLGEKNFFIWPAEQATHDEVNTQVLPGQIDSGWPVEFVLGSEGLVCELYIDDDQLQDYLNYLRASPAFLQALPPGTKFMVINFNGPKRFVDLNGAVSESIRTYLIDTEWMRTDEVEPFKLAVARNPNPEEIRSLLSKAQWKTLRVILNGANTYAWAGEAAIHGQVLENLGEQIQGKSYMYLVEIKGKSAKVIDADQEYVIRTEQLIRLAQTSKTFQNMLSGFKVSYLIGESPVWVDPNYRELNEAKREQVTNYQGKQITVLVNPTYRDILGLVTRVNEVRISAFVEGYVAWNAFESIHMHMEDAIHKQWGWTPKWELYMVCSKDNDQILSDDEDSYEIYDGETIGDLILMGSGGTRQDTPYVRELQRQAGVRTKKVRESVEEIGNTRVWVDPSLEQLKSLTQTMALRGLFLDGHTYCWDAFDDSHMTMFQKIEQCGTTDMWEESTMETYHNAGFVLVPDTMHDGEIEQDWDLPDQPYCWGNVQYSANGAAANSGLGRLIRKAALANSKQTGPKSRNESRESLNKDLSEKYKRKLMLKFGKLTTFAEMPQPFQLAIANYMAVDGEAWQSPSVVRHYEQPRAKSLKNHGPLLLKDMPEFIRRYGKKRFYIAEVPTEIVVQEIYKDPDVAEGQPYAGKRQARGKQGELHGTDNRWPSIVSSFDNEFLQDGWNRFAIYQSRGDQTVPLVMYA